MSHFSSQRSMWVAAWTAATLALGCGGTTVDVLPDANTQDTSPTDLTAGDDVTLPPSDLGTPGDSMVPPNDTGTSFCSTVRCMDGTRCCEALRMCQPAGVLCPAEPPPPPPPPPVDGGSLDAGSTFCGTNAECRTTSQYCAGMGCGTRGTCVTRPELCPTVFAPVCGCDGNTYENECRAAAAGIRVASTGMCSTGSFCARALCAPGTRCCEALMRCLGPTETCPGDPVPVDGGPMPVDAGPMRDTGPMPVDAGPATCRGDRDCAAGQSCCAATGLCYVTTCRACCMVVPPVDAGVDVPLPTRCSVAADCGRGRECVYPDNACVRDGVCMDAIACTTAVTFCSCSGVTYTGCRPDRPTMSRTACAPSMCRSNAECPTGQYCAGTGCGTAGTCAVRGSICPAVVDPVCGCDGRTYNNACEAAVAGVRVASRGACAPTSFCATVLCAVGTVCCESLRMCIRTGTACPGVDAGVVDGGVVDAGPAACRTNADCSRAQYCAGAGCDTAGTCQMRPTACSDVFAPVCGCDGRTYGNSCEAAAAGVRVATTRACPVSCTTTAECGRGRECVYPDTVCVRSGTCMDAIACLRPETFCSCTGVTYMSCRADRPTMSRTACAPPTCRSNADCGATQYCAAAGCDTPGTCQTRPMACITLYDPVCGCDGRTYSNSCTAAAAGVRVASRGECAPSSFCAMVRCAPGNFCCEATRACIPFGTACSTTGACTNDTQCGGTPYGCCAGTGRCYDTRCLACCMVRPGTCRSNADCTATQYCAGTGCDTAGTCTTTPTICTRELNPQCGCDGRTYSNPCAAAAARVRIASAGACP